MSFPRSVPRAPFAAAACLALLCLAPTRAHASNDSPPPTGSVQQPRKPNAPPQIADDRLTPEQVAETADYLLGGLAQLTQAVVLTMTYSPWDFKQTPPDDTPEVTVSSVVQPPAPSDTDPGNGPGPQGGPTPSSSDSPEPGTLVGGLVGAGACLCRYYRRRRSQARVAE